MTWKSGPPADEGFPEDDKIIAEVFDLPKPRRRSGRELLKIDSIKPRLTIKDPQGKQIVAKDLEYG